MNAAERPSHGAPVRMPAIRVTSKAVRKDNRTIDRTYYFKGRDKFRIARQPVAPVCTKRGNQKSRFSEFLQQLGHDWQRNTARLGYFLCAQGFVGFPLPGRKMLESNKTVIRLLC
jgi:hypothetical protein